MQEAIGEGARRPPLLPHLLLLQQLPHLLPEGTEAIMEHSHRPWLLEVAAEGNVPVVCSLHVPM